MLQDCKFSNPEWPAPGNGPMVGFAISMADMVMVETGRVKSVWDRHQGGNGIGGEGQAGPPKRVRLAGGQAGRAVCPHSRNG